MSLIIGVYCIYLNLVCYIILVEILVFDEVEGWFLDWKLRC